MNDPLFGLAEQRFLQEISAARALPPEAAEGPAASSFSYRLYDAQHRPVTLRTCDLTDAAVNSFARSRQMDGLDWKYFRASDKARLDSVNISDHEFHYLESPPPSAVPHLNLHFHYWRAYSSGLWSVSQLLSEDHDTYSELRSIRYNSRNSRLISINEIILRHYLMLLHITANCRLLPQAPRSVVVQSRWRGLADRTLIDSLSFPQRIKSTNDCPVLTETEVRISLEAHVPAFDFLKALCREVLKRFEDDDFRFDAAFDDTRIHAALRGRNYKWLRDPIAVATSDA